MIWNRTLYCPRGNTLILSSKGLFFRSTSEHSQGYQWSLQFLFRWINSFVFWQLWFWLRLLLYYCWTLTGWFHRSILFFLFLSFFVVSSLPEHICSSHNSCVLNPCSQNKQQIGKSSSLWSDHFCLFLFNPDLVMYALTQLASEHINTNFGCSQWIWLLTPTGLSLKAFADMTSENPLLLIILDLYNVSLLFQVHWWSFCFLHLDCWAVTVLLMLLWVFNIL